MVDPTGPILPVIPLVIRLRPQLEVSRVQAQAVVAAVANHLIPPGDLALQDTVDEPVGVGLAASEDHLAGVGGRGVTMQPVSVSIPSAMSERARCRASSR